MKIDLRSDTVTRPTAEMLDFMMKAKVGDDVYKEDPTVNALEEKLALMFGMDQALYFPTGTMANQAAIKIHTQPGEQLIAHKYAHVYNYEGGGVSFNSGVSCCLLAGASGKITADDAVAAINAPDFYHSPLTSLVCLENTTNKGGGAYYSLQEMKAFRMMCDQNDLGLHLDGARIWNALVASGQNPNEIGGMFDTISVCLSKGLGAPMGSVLLGKQKFMTKALRVRKILGGGMRQMGYMAAAGIFALENNLKLLTADHVKARQLGDALIKHPSVKCVQEVFTNIVIFEIHNSKTGMSLLEIFDKNSVLYSDMGSQKLRLVTHLDYCDVQHQKVLQLLESKLC